jgi:uncharacterized protein (TIGR02996 family)
MLDGVTPHDANALMSAVLADPADRLRRLLLADYLDDLGGPANAAWAEFLRLRAATADEPSPLRRDVMADAARVAAGGITARLTLPAAAFFPRLPDLFEVLPADRFTVQLGDHAPLLMNDTLCREHRGLPLYRLGDGRTVVGLIPAATAAGRRWWDGRVGPAVFVGLPPEDLERGLQRNLQRVRRQPVVVTAEFEPVTLTDQLAAASAEVMRGFVEQLVAQARGRGATAIDLTAYADHYWVRRTEAGRSLRWHRVSAAVGRELVRAARVLPARRLGVRVRPRNSSLGEGVRITLLAPPGGSHAPAPAGTAPAREDDRP